MDEEMQMMTDRKVWDLKVLPNNRSIVGCRWVYTLKRGEEGEIVRYKARLVAQGFKQIKGESFDETFSPVVNFGVIRFFFSLLVSVKQWVHIQCDIKSAYLYAPLQEEVYMSQPPGFSQNNNLVCKLNKALYGLHQSGRMWFFEIDKVLHGLGFIKFEWGNCIYSFKNSLILLLYVDDIVLFGLNKDSVQKGIKLLQNHFDLKILGKTRKLLGVQFEEGECMCINQTAYIEEIQDRFKSFKAPISSLPISKGIIFSKTQSPQTNTEQHEMMKYPYRNLLGCLSYLASHTRPDISYAVNIMSQFQANPGIFHWNGLLRILGYIISTKLFKLNLSTNNMQLKVYSDADFASNRDDRTSMSGQLLLLGEAPIFWRTFKQKCISLSTMESEFVAMTEAAKELIWYDRILKECITRNIISEPKTEPTLLGDNTASIDFISSPIENCRTKHIDVKLFFIRNLVFDKALIVKYIPSKKNLADAFTRPLTKHDLYVFLKHLFKNC